MRKILTSIALLFLFSAGANAQSMGAFGPGYPPFPSASWNIYLGTSQTGVTSATRTVVAFDTAATTGGGNANGFCDLVTHKGRCTPTVPGVYQVGCAIEITSGSVVTSGNEIGLVTIRKNTSTLVADGDGIAQVATLGTTNIEVSTSALVSFNGTTDYTECLGYSDGTGNAVAFPTTITRTRFFATYVHP